MRRAYEECLSYTGLVVGYTKLCRLVPAGELGLSVVVVGFALGSSSDGTKVSWG